MQLSGTMSIIGIVIALSGAVAMDVKRFSDAAEYIGLAVMLGGSALAKDDTVPPDYLFQPGTPVGSVSLTVTFDPDEDEGAGKTSSDFPDDHEENDEAFGELFMSSPNDAALSDLSERSDWVLTGCDPHGLERQAVVAFCSKNLSTSTCAHVFRGQAEHTIVQMPKGCGKGPLARVHALAVHPHQHTVLSLADRKKKPETELVYQLVFDYDFTLIPEDNGPVYMRADASDMPGYWDAIVDSPTEASELGTRRRRRRGAARYRRSELERRGWWSSFVNWVKKVTTVKSSKEDKRASKYSDTVTLFNSSKDCGTFTASLAASVSAHARTIVPPNIDKAFVYFNGDAAAGASVTITGMATVEYDSSRVQLATFPFAGLVVPGIITVGPRLAVDGYISGSMTVSGSLTAGVEVKLPPIQVAVGPGSNSLSKPVDPVSPPTNSLSSSLTAGVAISADAAIHVVPAVQLAVSVLGGKLVDSYLYIESDLSVGVVLNSSISTTQPFTVCVNPYFGLELQAGLRGSLGPWKGQAGPYGFYDNRFDIASQCYRPGARRANTLVPEAYPLALSGPRKVRELRPYSSPAHEAHTAVDMASNIEKRLSLPGFLKCPKKT